MVPTSTNAKESVNPEINIIENAVSYIEKLKCQLSNEEIVMLDQMFSFTTSVNRKESRNQHLHQVPVV